MLETLLALLVEALAVVLTLPTGYATWVCDRTQTTACFTSGAKRCQVVCSMHFEAWCPRLIISSSMG